ncbi:MAG: FMN-binding protein [Cyclobacteriaceae bacterium]|nr:FMN-binding protein [Cyclobacteriaceae bacterium]
MTVDNVHIEEEKESQPTILQEKEPSSFRLISSLGIAGFFSGLVLVSVYVFTQPLIEANRAEALQNAIFKVLPACESFVTLQLRDGKLIELKQKKEGEKSSKQEKEVKQIFAGYDKENKFVGFAIPGSETGFQDVIVALFGYDSDAKVIIGFEVLESKETPGLGDKIFKDADFQLNFEALAVEPEIISVKNGEKKNNNEVESITGATISSKAIVRLLNNTMDIYKSPINEYLNDQAND